MKVKKNLNARVDRAQKKGELGKWLVVLVVAVFILGGGLAMCASGNATLNPADTDDQIVKP